ncbi:hypothetical protein [Streptomyces marincola]|uniref:hypothetical protein n=1 Tax=Streptomyces marincola TaxID=2878388 RepID=UPI001CF285FF|nr:hypothetical protein [Streptomyces marincola]UCM91489.1 hypothetical protein LC193_28025 [Streptomyces marincola]
MSACRHLARELDRRDDGAHCPDCDILIYPAIACVGQVPPRPDPPPSPRPDTDRAEGVGQ